MNATHDRSSLNRLVLKTLLLCLITLLMASGGARAETAYYRDLFPDTWVAQDALGRNMPAFSVTGPVKKDQRHVVGIFYITWHSDSLGTLKSPYTADVSRVLAGDPKARLDAKTPALDGRLVPLGRTGGRATS